MSKERPSLSNWLASKDSQAKVPSKAGAQENRNTGTFGDIVDLAQAGALESVSGAAEFVGLDTAADYLKEQAGAQYETLSPEMAKSMAKRFINDDLTIGEGAKDWRAWLGQAAKLTGQMATTMIPGGAVGKGAQLLGAGAKLAKGAQAATLMAGGVATAGGMQGQGVADDINSMSFADLRGSKDFQNLAIKYSDQGMSATDAMAKARSDIADKAQDQVMYDPTLAGLNALAGYVGDAAMGKLIKGSLGKTIKGNIAKGILAEAPTEGLQGGYGQYVSNIAKGDAGLEQDAMQGVYAAALEEGLIAGGVGGAGGLAGGSGRAMINRLDKRVDTQDKIEKAATDSIKQLVDSGVDEAEIRETVGAKLEKAAMNKGHDADDASAIASQTIDYALGRAPSVLERQSSSLKKANELKVTHRSGIDSAQDARLAREIEPMQSTQKVQADIAQMQEPMRINDSNQDSFIEKTSDVAVNKYESDALQYLVGDVFSYMVAGDAEKAKENRVAVSGKAEAAIKGLAATDKARAVSLISDIDETVRDKSKGKWGVMSVVGGSGTSIGKYIESILSSDDDRKERRNDGGELDFNSIQFKKNIGSPVSSIPQRRVEGIAKAFVSGYKGAADINVRVVSGKAELERALGGKAIDGDVSGVWDSKSNSVYIVADNHASEADVRKTMRHEMIAHHGLMDSLSDSEHEDLTTRVMATRNIHALKGIWAEVDAVSSGESDSVKAEEVIARLAEEESGAIRKIADKVISWVMGALRRTGLVGKESITLSEVRELINSADAKLKKGDNKKLRNDGVNFSRKVEGHSAKQEVTVSDVLNSQQKDVFTEVKRALSSNQVADKLKQNKYAALTLRQLSEVGASRLSDLTNYVDGVNKMMATQNVLAEDVAEITSKVSGWAKKNKEKSKHLFAFMHDATIAGVDPSKPFDSMVDLLGVEDARIKRRISDSGSKASKDLSNRLKAVREAIDGERGRKLKHDELREVYLSLPSDSKEHFKAMRDHYSAQRERMNKALRDNIKAAEIDESVKKEMLRTIRFDNERAKKGVYFPLARFGEYWIEVDDENGQRNFSMYETETDMNEKVKQLQDAGFSPKYGTKLSKSSAVGGASIGFVSDVINNINKMNLTDSAKKTLTDDVYQLYLSSMPDRSLRRAFIHRKGVAGFSQDAIRAMADQGFKQSRQQARLEHMDELNKYMSNMKGKAEVSNDVETGRIYNEMVKRHEWVQNPQRSAWAQKLTGLGFVWLLGLTPAAALVNLTQNVQVALPVIGSKYGIAKTSGYMAKATADFFKAMPVYFKKRDKYGILGSLLVGHEKEAIREAIKQGVIDTTQASDLVGLAENPSAQYTGTWNKAMNMIGWAFQKAEVFNREVTFITAYRLEYDKSKDHETALKYAVKATWDSHFDYGSLNRARFMQSDIAAVALQFKQYSQNMSYYLYTNLIKSFKKGTPKAERDMARKQLMWTMVMTFGIGGMNALPLAFITAPMAMAQAMFGDDDDPFDPDVELKKMLSDYFGDEIAKSMWYGVSPSISGRISLDSLWWRENDRDLPADQAYLNVLQQAMGPVLGGIGMSAARGIEDMSKGNYMRGAEQMTPKAVKDMLRTVRYVNEGGVYNRAGDAIISDLTFAENLGQVAGFVPSRLVTQYDQNSALKGYEMQAKNRRSQLMNAYYMAYKNKDSDAMANIRKRIGEWNRSSWGRVSPITMKKIRQLIKRRLRNLAEMDRGLKLERRYKKLLNEYRYFG